MTAYFVTRHSGAVEWAARRGIAAEQVGHFDVETIRREDIVLGTLPVNLVAEVCARGGRYFHLTIDLPPERRGGELSADEMERFGARLEEYRAERAGKCFDSDSS